MSLYDDGDPRPLTGAERAAAWRLWSIRGVQYRHIRRLEERMDGSLEALWERGRERAETCLAACELGTSTAEEVLEGIDAQENPLARYESELDALPEDADVVHLRDPGYPARLFDLEQPPVFLYVLGDLGACRRGAALSVVGSRDAGVRDVRTGKRIVGRVAGAGVSIVSGGALGIDRAAHEAAMEAAGETVVVLPSGLDCPTPRSNRDVFQRAVDQGAVISEYPVGVEVRRYHFPRRNRLIAALGDATFVVRAGPESGTMLTADAARELDRPICALPGGLDEPLAEGCLDLIAEGAQAVRHADDILERHFPGRADDEAEAPGAPSTGTEQRRDASERADLSDDASALLEAVRDADEEGGIWHADRLRELVEWGADRLQTALLELELHGCCEKAGGAQAYRFSRM